MTEERPIRDNAVLAQLTSDVGEEALPILMQALAAELSKSMQTIREALGAQDFELLETTAHALKSATASFGAVALSDVCLSLEMASRDHAGTADFPGLLRDLDHLAAQTRSAYNLE